MGIGFGYHTKRNPAMKLPEKYLFFSEDKNKLIEIAKNEIMNLHFHKAKVSEVIS